MTMPVVINKATELKALLDSGASNNFIHQETARKLGLTPIRKQEPQEVKDIQGKNLGWISHYVKVMLDAAQHQEIINLNIIPLGIHGLVIGLPWLQKHDPDIKWSKQKIRFSSMFCKENCNRRSPHTV